jgi:hypothetical protein
VGGGGDGEGRQGGGWLGDVGASIVTVASGAVASPL